MQEASLCMDSVVATDPCGRALTIDCCLSLIQSSWSALPRDAFLAAESMSQNAGSSKMRESNIYSELCSVSLNKVYLQAGSSGSRLEILWPYYLRSNMRSLLLACLRVAGDCRNRA